MKNLLPKFIGKLLSKFIIVPIIISFIVVSVNIFIYKLSGSLDFYTQDALGGFYPGLQMVLEDTDNYFLKKIQESFSVNSGFHHFLIAAGYKLFGMGLWQPNLIIFWQTLLILSLVSWIAYANHAASLLLPVSCLIALLPLLSHGANYAASLASDGLIAPASVGATLDLVRDSIFKADFLAGAALAWSVALITVRRAEASWLRFSFSGIMLSVAVLAKGHFAPVYLAAWGSAVLVNASMIPGRSARYILHSYSAAIPLGVAFVAWTKLGGLDAAIEYIIESINHPLRGSPDYEPLGGGFLYFLSLSPLGMGVPGMILLLLATIFLIQQPNPGRFRVFGSAIVFIICAFMILTPVILNPFGKNLSMMIPVFIMIWIMLITILSESFHYQNIKKNLIRITTASALAVLLAIGLSTVYGWNLITLGEDEKAAIQEDRETLKEISALLASQDITNVVSPLMGTGAPRLFELYMALETGKIHKKNFFLPAFLSEDKLINDIDYFRSAKELIINKDMIIIIRGGPDKFPDLGPYMKNSYFAIENIIDHNIDNFNLLYQKKLEKSNLWQNYFRRQGGNMTIQIFQRISSPQ